MSRLHQITDDDLATLESSLALIYDSVMSHVDPATKRRFIQAKLILSNVRWGYGPHSEVEEIEDGDA